MKRLAAAALFATATTAHGQDLPALSDVLSKIEGTEVQATGEIRRIYDDTPYLWIRDSGSYTITPALDRNKLKELNACADATNCTGTIKAELAWEGHRMTLIVFSFERL